MSSPLNQSNPAGTHSLLPAIRRKKIKSMALKQPPLR